jgi:hypothetical protein
MSKYLPISEHLRSLPLSQSSESFTFATLEKVLGFGLPNTARVDRPWWANTLQSNHAKAWMSAGWKVHRVDLKQQTVTFARDSEAAAQTTRGSDVYRRVAEFFEQLPGEQTQVALLFQELEAVRGRPLPKTAFRDRTWWANAKEYSPSRDWLAAGWKLESVFLPSAIAVFRRKQAATLESVRACVKRFLGDDHAGPVPDPRRAAEWISLCRRIGWYFEGTVLFERCGIAFASLGDDAQASVEEDYGICRRELDRYKAVPQASAASRTGRS